MRTYKILISIFFSLAITSCSDPNVFQQFSNQTSDEALYKEALKKIDALDYTAAIDIITNQMSAGSQARVDVKESLMGAYAGKCGLTFVTLIDGLSSTAETKIFPLALGAFGAIAIDTTSCDKAVDVLKSLGTSTQRTSNQNLFAAFLGLAKMGVNLRKTLDREFSGLGDGVVDGGYDVCAAPTGTTDGQLTDDEMKKVITGLGLVFDNIATLIASIGNGNDGVNALDAAKSQCESIPGVTSCTFVDEADIDAMTIAIFRKMIASTELGFGSCNVITCCP